jgi:CRISPR-associated protein Csx10
MKALTYRLHLVEPVLATQPHAGEANSATSYPYIPGSMIRGALIAAYLEDNPTDDLAAVPEARRLFFDGPVCYLHAYPFNVDKRTRLLPTPLSWVTEKDKLYLDDVPVYDLAVEQVDLDKPKAARGTFCHLEGNIAYMGTPETQVNVHNASEDRNRKEQGVSQVYRYEALAAGQTLAGAILAEAESDLSQLKVLLETKIMLLGGSHTGGYGRVEVQEARIEEWTGEYQSGLPDDAVIVTLLSDTIIRTGSDDLALTLVKMLGLDESVVQHSDYRVYFQVGVVGGFNRKWGLPLPQEWVLRAGSVFRFPAGTTTDWERLVAEGIGERWIEGYGRIAVNWQTQAKLRRTGLPLALPVLPPQLSDGSQELAQRMANRLLRDQLEQGLAAAVIRTQGQFRALPSPSQLSRVRLAARHALFGGAATAIADHVENLRGAKANWRDARLGRQLLLEWIEKNSQLEETDFKEQFGITASLPSIGSLTAELTDEIRREYCTRLVDGVMKLAVEEVKRRRGGG